MKRTSAVIILLALGQVAGYGQLRQVAANANPPRSLLVTVTPRGLYPPRIEMTEGPFVLRIQNRSMAQTMTVALTKGQGGAALLNSQHTPRRFDVRQVIDPQPGTYHLTVVEHPQWDLTLVIKPR
jgi:hypothetical protein